MAFSDRGVKLTNGAQLFSKEETLKKNQERYWIGSGRTTELLYEGKRLRDALQGKRIDTFCKRNMHLATFELHRYL